jgi:hypothetical protein
MRRLELSLSLFNSDHLGHVVVGRRLCFRYPLIDWLIEFHMDYSSLSFEAFCRDIMWNNKAYTKTTPPRTISSTKIDQAYDPHGGDSR